MALTSKQEAFAVAVAKGENASTAYRGAYDAKNTSPAAVHVEASRLMANPKVSLRISELSAPAAKLAGLTVERTLQEVARLAYSDPRKMFRPDGSMIPIAEMDDDTAACVASFKHDTFDGGEEGESGSTTKLKVWDKNAALEKAMKHLGLYERDNSQRAPNLALQIVLVGPV